MKYIKILYIVLFVRMCVTATSIGQDLENLDKNDFFSLTGGIHTNHVFYTCEGMERRRDTYQYIFSANMQLKFLLWDIPLSFTYTNKKGKLQHSLNQLNLRPSYKWLTLYVGKVSMNFSPYTMAGRLFEGIGIDVKPEGKFKASAFYGRQQKTVSPDTSVTPAIEPTFKRMAYGIKGAYKPNNGILEMIFYRGEDDVKSLTVKESLNMKVEHNTVVSLRAEQSIFEYIKLHGEIANSHFSYEVPYLKIERLNNLTLKDQSYQALNGGVDVVIKEFNAGIGYERVDPGYHTHGAYYFNNDLENITLRFSSTFLKNKLQVNANTGMQRDNLENNKMSKTARFVGSGTVSYRNSERWNAAFSYSNFRSYTRMWKNYEEYQLTAPYEDIDTLNYVQISQNVNGQVNIELAKTDHHQHQLNAFGSYQSSGNYQGEENSGKNMFLNASIMHIWNITSVGLTISPGFSGYGSTMQDMKSVTAGPVVSIAKTSQSKKLQCSLIFNYNHSYVHDSRQHAIGTSRFIGRYTFRKKHRFSLLVTHLFENQDRPHGNTSEMTVTFNYRYRFK